MGQQGPGRALTGERGRLAHRLGVEVGQERRAMAP